MSGLKGSYKFSSAFKEQVINEYISGPLSKEQLRVKYSIGGKSTILEWLRTLGDRVNNQSFKVDSKDKLKYQIRIKQLEEQLEQEKLKRIAAETIIDIAQEQLNIDIRKKSVTKQSKK